jgi:hypothetical protein
MSRSAPRELTEVLRRYEPDVQAVALATRSGVLDVIGPCLETIFPVYRNSVISILYSTTEKFMKDNVCLVVIYRDHVNLMFPRGVDMTDPRGLLEGAGKAMRHVKMRTAADTTRPGVRELIKQARKRPGLGEPARPLTKVVTMLKAKKASNARLKPRAPANKFPRLF